MPFPLLLAIGAGLGAVKHYGIDRPQEERERKLAAATQRLSPWTGLQAGPISHPDLLGSMLNFGLTSHQIDKELGKGADKDVNPILLSKTLNPNAVQYPAIGGGAPGGPNPFSSLGAAPPAVTTMGPVGVPAYQPGPYSGMQYGGGWR